MAVVSKLQASKQPPINLKPMINFEDYTTVRTQYEYTGANGQVFKKNDCPFAPDSSGKGRLVRCLHEPKGACWSSLRPQPTPTALGPTTSILTRT